MLKDPAVPKIGSKIELQAQETIRALVATIPGARFALTQAPTDKSWDFEVEIRVGSSRQRLLCDVKTRAWPNELHAVANRLQQGVRENLPDRSIPVLVAPYLSPQAIQFCRSSAFHGLTSRGIANLKQPEPTSRCSGTQTLINRGGEQPAL